MILNLDFESEIPIYQQLRSQIIEGIAMKKLKPGETLPSVRQMASDIGINMHTVNKTYTLLKQDGFITVHRQKGVTVNKMNKSMLTDEYLSRLKQNLRILIAEAACRGVNKDNFTETSLEIFSYLKKGE
ncbi:MAG: GntR family transcriptional regulator [Clostridiales bacterium]